MNRTATSSVKPSGFHVLRGVDFNRCRFWNTSCYCEMSKAKQRLLVAKRSFLLANR